MPALHPAAAASRSAVAALAVVVAAALVAVPTACGTPAAEPLRAAIAPPSADAVRAVDLQGLHNVVAYVPDVFSGGQPEGADGLETLAAMGVRTVVSVDGAAPDVERAERLGLRYVHLPISYDTVTAERQRQLAQVLHQCERPIYVHCHHGKHRSAAALASGLIGCGTLSPEQGRQRMTVSGTAPDYTGLWAAVAAATPLTAAQLSADPASFPSVTQVTGMVATMAEIDAVFDLVKQAKHAGWRPPQDHPDLVPSKETRRLATLLARLADDGDSARMTGDYQALLAGSITHARTLDAALRADDHAGAAAALQALAASCKQCHAVHRDR